MVLLDADESRIILIHMITTITGKNQVTVPAALASRANIRAGTKLDWELGDTEDTLIVHVIPDPGTLAARLRGRGKRCKSREGSAVENLIAERTREDQGGT